MYHRSHTYKTIASMMLVVFVCVTTAPYVFAEDLVGTNFIVGDASVNGFGGDATSTSFQAFDGNGQVLQTEATSTSFVLNGDPLFFDNFSPRSAHWRWYDDETNETPSSSLSAENVAPAGIQNQNIIKLRLAVHEVGGVGLPNVKLRLQFATSSDFATAYYVAEQGVCSEDSAWCYANGAGADNAVITNTVLTGSDACSGGVGNGCGTHNESGVSSSTFEHVLNATTEYEFTLKQSGAAANTVYFFRAVDANGGVAVPLDTDATYPSLSANGAELVFNIEGLPSATTTEGVVVDVDTSSTVVPFGALSLSVAKKAAHRLSVSTNAAEGYRIFVYQRQGFVGQGSDEISPVSTTNLSPATWESACNASASGCFGYHTGEDLLSSGSVSRFAADNTYASFTSIPAEVAYSAVPASNRSTDIVYQVEVRGGQESGDYSTDLVYIITPIF